ncbi:MAG: Rpn family recombination-promoting nuclease/putative transposase, partial [Chitinispirillales bacterium]|nr:Rpn family recombination-promoting nuclease/putative transposase [Chitinispirillales bacterium]
MKHTLISFDYAMKGILRDKANFVVLSGLLSELLGRDVAVFEILESESNAESRFGKSNKLDLKAKIDGGEIAIFEIQTGTQNDFFHRILFGTSKAVVEQLHRGDGYWKIKKVYSIDIVYFELGKGSDYI